MRLLVQADLGEISQMLNMRGPIQRGSLLFAVTAKIHQTDTRRNERKWTTAGINILDGIQNGGWVRSGTKNKKKAADVSPSDPNYSNKWKSLR